MGKKNQDAGAAVEGVCGLVSVSACSTCITRQLEGGEQRKKATSITEGRRENKSRSKRIK